MVTDEQISTMGLGRVVPTHELHVGFMAVGRLLDGLVIEFHQQARCQDRFPLSRLLKRYKSYTRLLETTSRL